MVTWWTTKEKRLLKKFSKKWFLALFEIELKLKTNSVFQRISDIPLHKILFPKSFVNALAIFLATYQGQSKLKLVLQKTFFKETLWPLFVDGVQLSQGYRATTRRHCNLFFTTKFTHFIHFCRMKGWVNLTATKWFWTWDPWIENSVP